MNRKKKTKLIIWPKKRLDFRIDENRVEKEVKALAKDKSQTFNHPRNKPLGKIAINKKINLKKYWIRN